MILLNYFGKLVLFLVCLMPSYSVFAEETVANFLELSDKQLKYYQKNNFKILAAIEIQRQTQAGEPLIEFSGLAWDQDQSILYALSDRGFIAHLKPIFKNDQLHNVTLISHHILKDQKAKPLTGKFVDSEGLELINANNNVQNDTELIISFERKPRIVKYSVNGIKQSELTLNNKLNNIKNYSGANKALEAISKHKKFGMITGPERPLKNAQQDFLALHTLKQKYWTFKPNNKNYGSLVGLTTLPDNQLIALERSFPGIFAGVSNTIHLFKLSDDAIEQETLINIDPIAGYFNENFEGITWHKDKRFFMISDDNDNLLQRTILIYFEIPSLNNE